jgi:hypothetical protein
MADEHADIRQELETIKGMIEGGSRSAAIIQEVVTYSEDFWDYMKSVTKCDDLIYSTSDYGEQPWINQRRAKIICDFLIFWSKTENRGPINEIIDYTGNLRKGAYATIQIKIAEDIAELNSLHGKLKIAITHAGDNVNALMERIKIKSMQLFAIAAFAADSVSAACKAAGGAVVDTGADTLRNIDQLLGQLINMNMTIDIPGTAYVSKQFIESIVGEHTDTIILMLEGLLTVCAGKVAVENYDAIFAAILNILNGMEGLIRVGVASTILYGIGTVMELLSKKLAAETGDKFNRLKYKSTQIAAISRRTRNTDGTEVDVNTIRGIRDEIRAVVESDAVEPPAVEDERAAQRQAAQAAQREDRDRGRQTGEGVQGRDDSRESRSRKRSRDGVLQQEREAAGTAAEVEGTAAEVEGTAEGGPQTGGKKHKKSQKKPRKKASKSKRSKKAGKKTRKSRKKTRGKKH